MDKEIPYPDLLSTQTWETLWQRAKVRMARMWQKWQIIKFYKKLLICKKKTV
jgi:hypothetical protein